MQFSVLILVACLELVLAGRPRVSYGMPLNLIESHQLIVNSLPPPTIHKKILNKQLDRHLPLILYNLGSTNYTICGDLGFTSQPGDNFLDVFPQPTVVLSDCIKSCRHNETCNAVAFAKRFSLCVFYSRFIRFDELNRDNSSDFAYYDRTCNIPYGQRE